MKRIVPTGDLAFRKVLSSEDTKDILSGLIKDFFGFYIPEHKISIENPYSIEAYRAYLKVEDTTEFRPTIKDVSASFTDADFTSELQVRKSRFYDEIILSFRPFPQKLQQAGAYGDLYER